MTGLRLRQTEHTRGHSDTDNPQWLPRLGGNRNTFEVMTSTLTLGTFGSVAFLLTLYQGNHDRNHKL